MISSFETFSYQASILYGVDYYIILSFPEWFELYSSGSFMQYIPRNMHTVFALLCFVVVIYWLIFPYPSGLLHWHCGNLTIAPVPAKQPWWIWMNTSCEFIMNNCITTTSKAQQIVYECLVHSCFGKSTYSTDRELHLTTLHLSFGYNICLMSYSIDIYSKETLVYTVTSITWANIEMISSFKTFSNQASISYGVDFYIILSFPEWFTVYPKKYGHGFCFAVLCCGYTLTDFPISIRLTSLALWQSNDWPSASKATLMNMDKYFMWIHCERLHNHNKAKHNKTVCIVLGIYCNSVWGTFLMLNAII